MLNGNVLYCGAFKNIHSYSPPGGTKRAIRVYDTAQSNYHLFVADGAVNDLDEMSKDALIQELAERLYNNGVVKLSSCPNRFSVFLD